MRGGGTGGTLILASQGSGKSFASRASSLIDLEEFLAFNEDTLKLVLSDNNGSNEFDLTHFWMRWVLPAVLACLISNKTVAVNMVSYHNAPMLLYVLRGLVEEQGFRVQVVLPSSAVVEERILARHGNQSAVQLRYRRGGLIHTASTRVLLAGLAACCGNIEVVDCVALSANDSVPPLFKQRVLVFSKHVIVETTPGVFVDFVDEKPALFFRLAGNSLFCDRGTKKCLREHGFECDFCIAVSESSVEIRSKNTMIATVPLLDKSSFSQFVPLHKLSTVCDVAEDNLVVLALYGSFAPFHRGHLEMLDLAKQHLESQQFRVIGAYVTPLMSVGRKKHMVEPLQSWYTRAAIVNHVLASHPFAMLDPQMEPYSPEWNRHPVHSLASRLAIAGKRVTVVWVNGSDASYDNISEEMISSSPLPVKLFVVPPRSGQEDRFHASKVTCGKHILLGESSQQLNISSTAVRELVVKGLWTQAAELIGYSLASSLVFTAFQESERIVEQRQLSLSVAPVPKREGLLKWKYSVLGLVCVVIAILIRLLI
jgi:nicotinic acid mononucleotide adenylyltransferase